VNSREAKDFLVQQATDQAQRDGVSLCELEKRMMYFTEGEDAVENPAELNEEFEANTKHRSMKQKLRACWAEHISVSKKKILTPLKPGMPRSRN
jgi:hypothetical protein